MSQSNNKELEMAVGTSNMLESSMMEGEHFYTPMETATEPESATQNTSWTGVKNDTGQLCRSCANSSDYLIPIYEGEGIEHQLEFKIQKHLPIQVSITDSLPLQLCYQCASTLIAWDNMITSCIEADKKLRAMQEAVEEELKNAEEYDDSHDSQVDTAPPAADSDDEPLITSKTKLLSEKNKATPIKKKILSKAKTKSLGVKTDKTATNSKEGEDKERSSCSIEENTGDITRKKKFSKEMESVSVINSNGALKRVYRCKLCGHLTNRSNNLKRHIQTHKRVLPYTCENCGKKYLRKPDGKEFANKIEIVLDCTLGQRKKLYRCKICGHSSNRSNNLKKHLVTHESLQYFSCENCGEKCREIESSNYHVKEIETITTQDTNGKNKKSYRCKLCGEMFPRKQKLRSHLASHKPINIFVCKVCAKEYLCEKSYKDHVTNVHGESSMVVSQFPYKCEYCDQLFTDKGLCEEHRLVHVGERPYICNVCGCAFRTQSSLYLHSKIHLSNVTATEELV